MSEVFFTLSVKLQWIKIQRKTFWGKNISKIKKQLTATRLHKCVHPFIIVYVCVHQNEPIYLSHNSHILINPK